MRKRSKWLAVLIPLPLLISLIAPVSANATYVADVAANYHSGYCATDQGGSLLWGTNVDQQDCGGDSPNHSLLWFQNYVSGSTTWFTLQNVHTGLCLNANNQNGLVDQENCGEGGGNVHTTWWRYDGTGPTPYTGLLNYHTGQCLVPVGDSQSAGTLLEVYGSVGSCGVTNHAYLWALSERFFN